MFKIIKFNEIRRRRKKECSETPSESETRNVYGKDDVTVLQGRGRIDRMLEADARVRQISQQIESKDGWHKEY